MIGSLTWVTCVVDEDYEININYPHQIRRRSNNRIISESLNKGYIRCYLNQNPYPKHRIIAKQFIPNPDNLPCVDHRIQDKINKHISNLRWAAESQNNFNKSSMKGIDYKYFDEIDHEVILVRHHSKWDFDVLCFTDNTFYFS